MRGTEIRIGEGLDATYVSDSALGVKVRSHAIESMLQMELK